MHDCKAMISALETEKGGRKKPFFNGYRPNHLIKPDYLTSGTHAYIDQDSIQPGSCAEGYIDFVTPEFYPESLWVGRKIRVQEGNRLVGIARILEVYNKLLLKDAPSGNFVGQLLDIYSKRLMMAEKGVTNPPENIYRELRKLVTALESRNDDDFIRIETPDGLGKLVCDLTEEVLAVFPLEAE